MPVVRVVEKSSSAQARADDNTRMRTSVGRIRGTAWDSSRGSAIYLQFRSARLTKPSQPTTT
jgi:hypothetical protein